jgi:hypothetical protein
MISLYVGFVHFNRRASRDGIPLSSPHYLDRTALGRNREILEPHAQHEPARLQSATLRRPSRRSLRSKPFVTYANEIPVAGSAHPS